MAKHLSNDCQVHQKHNLKRVPVTNLHSGNVEMTNLRTDEIAFFRSLTKIGNDENKAILSSWL